LYAFEGAAGDVITLRVTHAPGDVALQIELKGPDQRRLAISAPSQDGAATLAGFSLPADGTYRVTVQRPRSHDTKNLDYELTLSAAG
ncbi:MAG: PPC domain-containing protein, partial [Chloroflexota bacterium]